ncbi:ectomycorrhiza-regulated esterase [Mrakia frigida]|uniref:uncharacterized protein n=1 Tax=Mrakia frigida TaxID=29902 RepID=UPI003FCC072B
MSQLDPNSTKIRIPHTLSPGCEIVGILQRTSDTKEASSSSRKLALILHGVLGHKDYLHQKLLARSLPMDSFRFDFRGNHETAGEWSMAAFPRDVDDLRVVSKYLREELNYEIDLIVGHSRGALVSNWWLSHDEEEIRLNQVRKVVHLCGRYRMERIHDKDPIYDPYFNKSLAYPWAVRVASKPLTVNVTAAQIEEFASWDNSYAKTKFPKEICVLNVGAGRDTVVPPWDVFLWQREWQGRIGSTTMHVVELADHNLVGHHPEIVEMICGWNELVDREGKAPPVWDPALVAASSTSSKL